MIRHSSKYLGWYVIQAEIAIGEYCEEQVILYPITLESSDGGLIPFKCTQFPIWRLCFTMTINKAQGQTQSKSLIANNTNNVI